MLPSASRVHTRAEHALISRSGRRIRRGPIVVHYLPAAAVAPSASASASPAAGAGASDGQAGGPARAGFVVGRAVGNAVTRNRVRRRLREQVRARLPYVAPGTLLVVRALPESAIATSDQLGRALDGALRAMADGSAPAGRPRGERSRSEPARGERPRGGRSRGSRERGESRPVSPPRSVP